MQRLKPYRIILFLVAISILSAVISTAHGWLRYGNLIGLGIGGVFTAFWILFGMGRWYDWRVLPRAKAELTPILERMRVLAADGDYVSGSCTQNAKGTTTRVSVHGTNDVSYSLTVIEKRGRCNVILYEDNGTISRSHWYPNLFGDIKLEPWLRTPLMALYATVSKKQAIQDERLSALLRRVNSDHS